MQFVDNINPNPVSSRNAADIVLSGINTASKVSITISRNYSQFFTFTAEPYLGSVKIRLSDILRSIRPLAFLAPPAEDTMADAETVTISASAAGETSPTPWSRTVFHGGYDTALYAPLMSSYWWTWRDQKCRTFLEGKEYLGALFLSSTHVIYVEAKFSDGTTDDAQLYAVSAVAGKVFAEIDVSASRIAGLFPTKQLVSYTVYRQGNQYGQAYEVSPLRPQRVFVFRNSLGLFDTVYATGRVNDGLNRDIKTFIGEDRRENISDNDSRERISVNSGRIDTRGERTLWNEFVRSTDIWEYKAGTMRKIVLDNVDMKMAERLSASVSFEFHYSEEPAGNGFVKSAL